jgi:nitrous oxidase accessory protein NosD
VAEEPVRVARACLALLCAGLLSVAVTERARAAADSVLVRVGGDLTGRIGQTINVPITVDLSGAPGRQLGSYRGQLTWNPALLDLSQVKAGNFAQPQANISALNTGTAQVTAVLPAGAGGVVTVFIAQFFVLSDTAQSPVAVSFDEMSATATSVTPFEVLLPLLKYVQGTFCRSLGEWGDVNGDGQSNSLDALVALSVVVGLPVDTLVMKPALADVDGDGSVTSRDALIMLSYAVGLPVTGYRVLLPAAGACGTGAATTLVIAPDSVELQAGQGVAVLAQATDGSGRAVPAESLSWSSSNPTIAGYDPVSGQVKGRSPGFTTLTAQVGPGVQGTLKVSVLARRTTWYVDVQRALSVPVQVGSQGLPFQFIGDAIAVARDGDTVRVASGTYEEIVASSISVTLLGDSVNRPVLDPRGSPSWTSFQEAMDLGSAAAPLMLENLVVRAGTVYLAAHDVTVRNFAIQGLGTNGYAALEVRSVNLTPAPPARGGPMRAGPPEAVGNVVLDGVVVTADSTTNGILVDLADTAVVRNSVVTRALPGLGGSCFASSSSSSGILIAQASVSVVQNNVVANPECQGIGVFDDPLYNVLNEVGRATISRNRVTGAPGTGIAAGTRLVALDHNAVRNVGTGQICCQNFAGIEIVQAVTAVASDTVTSLADSVANVQGYYTYGLRVDTMAVGAVDSLVVDSVGGLSTQGVGFYFTGRRLTLTNSRISNSQYTGVAVYGQLVLHSRGNTVRNSKAGPGYLVAPSNCDCSASGADSALMAHDSIVGAGFNGLEIDRAVYAQVDTAVVDSVGASSEAIQFNTASRAIVRGSVARSGFAGIYASFVDTLSVIGDTLQASKNGVYVYFPTDTVTISGTVVDGNTGAGIYLDYQSKARIDSVVATNNVTGLYVFNTASAAVQRSRFQGNVTGMWMSSSAGTSSSVVNSNFLGNTAAGARNDAYAISPTYMLSADTNYWGSASGPSCDSLITLVGCAATGGDSIVTTGVTFGGFLTGSAPTPAPPRAVYASAATGRGVTAIRQAVPPPRPAAQAARPAVVAQPAQVRPASVPRGPRVMPAPWHRASRSLGIHVSRRR